ncbi:MAG: DUF4397 domain-containing protein [Gemmatimonadales bacterium]
MQTQVFRRLSAAALALPLLAGCGGTDVNPFDPTRDAKLRLLHASSAPGGQADFLLAGVRAARLDYGQPTNYLTVSAGTLAIGMQSLPDDDGNPILTFLATSATITAGQFHTVVITGPEGNVAAVTATEGGPPAAGNVSLRVLHAGETTAALDLYVTAPDADLNAATPLVTGIDPREVTDYQVIGTATLQVRLTTTGTKTPLIASSPTTFADRQVTTLFVVDHPTPGEPPVGFFLPDGGALE